MPTQNYFKQVDEKHVSAVVEHMAWSPKMDLIALSNGQGEVILYRLSWQKVWSLAAPAEGVMVTALAWRPDGKVVAVGYTTGKLLLCDVENAGILHEAEIEGQITHLSWISQSLPQGTTWSNKPYPEDDSEVFLPKLQSLNKSYGTLSKGQSEESAEDSKHLKSQTLLNILVVGSDLDLVHLYGYGVFPLAYIKLGIQTTITKSKVLSATVSEDLLTLSLFTAIQNDDNTTTNYYLLSYDLALVASRHKEFRLLALKYGKVYSLLSYLKSTIQQMSEAWEDILIEMDSKLLKFAENKKSLGTGTVSTDFLELLMFGIPSPELQAFLLHDLTEKGLKKLGRSIESSYSNIQKLVLKHLQNVSQCILYELSDLRGMSLWYDKFGVLALNTALLQKAVSSAGSFLLKTSELQQVIDGSIKNFKAFFRWLYVVIMRLSEEQPPPELNKMTQYDMNFVAEFLQENFTQFSEEEENEDLDNSENLSTMEDTEDKKPRFKLEKVGQYLKNEDLLYPPEVDSNPWNQFVETSPNLKESSFLYKVEAEKSLVQLHEKLEGCISSALTHPATVIGKSLLCVNTCHLFSSPLCEPEKDKDNSLPTICQFTMNDSQKLFNVFTSDPKPSDHFFILRQPTNNTKELYIGDIVRLSVGQLSQPELEPDTSANQRPPCNKHKILDLSFYDQKTLSLLLVEDNEESLPVLAQLPLAALEDHMFTPVNQANDNIKSADIKTVDIGPLIEASNWKLLENMKAMSFAVSGTRKVACVLLSSRRRVRLFLMDMEEDEEDEADESQLESETSHHDNGRHDESMVSQSAEVSNDENKENSNMRSLPEENSMS